MFKVPDWDDDTPKSDVKFAKRIKRKNDKTASELNTNHVAHNNFIKHERDNVVNAKNNEKNLHLVVSCGKSTPRKRKHDNIVHTKATHSNIATDSILEYSSKKQKQNDKANKNKKLAEDLNLYSFYAADELLVNEKKKILEDEMRNEDQEALLFNEANRTIRKKKTKPTKKSNDPENNHDRIDQKGTKHKANMKNQKENVKGPDLQASEKVFMYKSKESSTEILKKRNSKERNTKEIKQLGKKDNNEDSNVTDASSENETSIVLYENKPQDRKKKLKLKAILQANRNSIHISGDELRERMMQRLKAAQFRYLNEKLYTSSGSEAQQLFQADPRAFQTYHQGYQQQLKKWPVNPLDVIVKRILKMPKSHVIADMGCGEAALSMRVPHTVRSFDLVSTSPRVEACDMARTPLAAGAAHAAVYCLALMGTQLTQYLLEANRILKKGGQLLIAEVESRFTDVDAFARDVQRLGFKLTSLDKTQRVFYFMQFQKTGDPPVKKAKLPELTLNPCLYKKR